MKKVLLTAAFGVMMVALLHGQVTNGLVAKYSFNNGDATDDVGSNDGVVTRASLTADRFGNTNAAYSFTDGEYIALPDAPALKSSTMTTSLWVKVNGYNAGPNPENFIYSTINNPTAAYFAAFTFLVRTQAGQYYAGSQNGPGQSTFGVSANGNNGTWQHFVLAMDDDSLKMYIDGQKEWSLYKGFTTTFTADSVYVGVSGNSTYYGNFNGLVDDIRVYDRVLNDAEVDSLFNETDPFVVGISESNNQMNALNVSPNPAKTSLRINVTQPTTIALVNTLGQILTTLEVGNERTIDVMDLEPGIYFVRDLNTGKAVKFVKN